jgi:small GTP-binding protein
MSGESIFKVAFTGEPATGKTCIITKIREQDADLGMLSPTIGPDCYPYKLEMDGKKFQVRLQDCPGNPSVATVFTAVYRDVDAVVLVFSLADASIFPAVSKWSQKGKELSPANAKFLIVGNKNDLARAVSEEEGRKLQEELAGVDGYLEVSALTTDGIDDLKQHIADWCAATESKKGPEKVIIDGSGPGGGGGAKNDCC